MGLDMKKYSSQTLRLLATMSLAACCLSPLHAEEASANNEWNFSGGIYLWGTAIGGETSSGSEIDITFSDLIQNLDMAFMGNLEARHGKWFVAADLFYSDISASGSHGFATPNAGDVGLGGSVVTELTIFTPTLGYNLIDSKTGTMDGFIGVQAANLDVSAKIASVGPAGGRLIQASDTIEKVDGIVGVKGKLNLEGNWSLPYYLNIGAGGSDFTWQAFSGIDYKLDRMNLYAGYRYLEWELNEKVVDNMNLNGPIIGVNYNF
jgi:hypothetical protein